MLFVQEVCHAKNVTRRVCTPLSEKPRPEFMPRARRHPRLIHQIHSYPMHSTQGESWPTTPSPQPATT